MYLLNTQLQLIQPVKSNQQLKTAKQNMNTKLDHKPLHLMLRLLNHTNLQKYFVLKNFHYFAVIG